METSRIFTDAVKFPNQLIEKGRVKLTPMANNALAFVSVAKASFGELTETLVEFASSQKNKMANYFPWKPGDNAPQALALIQSLLKKGQLLVPSFLRSSNN